jgi:hypothetical protein
MKTISDNASAGRTSPAAVSMTTARRDASTTASTGGRPWVARRRGDRPLSRARYPSANHTPRRRRPTATSGRHPRPGQRERDHQHGFPANPGTPILALEARLADVEGGYGDTLYKLHRASIKADLRTAKILQHLDIEDVSDEQIDAALDVE